MAVPDFSYYRRKSTRDPAKKTDPAERDARNSFTYVMTGALAVGGAYSGKVLVNDFVSSMAPAQLKHRKAFYTSN